MSKVFSLRLKEKQVERLQRAARQMGRSPSETAALLLEEALRQRDFAFVEFRDSPVGRQAYIQGTRLTVWWIVSLVRGFGGDVARTAALLEVPSIQVAAALRYAEAFPKEIEEAITDSTCTFEDLARLIPNLEVIEVDAPTA